MAVDRDERASRRKVAGADKKEDKDIRNSTQGGIKEIKLDLAAPVAHCKV